MLAYLLSKLINEQRGIFLLLHEKLRAGWKENLKNLSKCLYVYTEVPNRRADRNKRAGLEKSGTLLAYLLSKLINEQGGIFHFTK